jgi:acid phosphatase type 7
MNPAHSHRKLVLRSLLAAALFAGACTAGNESSLTEPGAPPPPAPGVTPPPAPGATPPPAPGPALAVLIGAGDIANCGNSNDEATARLLDQNDGVVFTAGDNAYDDGSVQDFQQCYTPTWGRHLGRTRPSPGNHDYDTSGAAPYYAYFGSNAGPAGLGYYSYDLAGWHIVSLNSNIAAASGSPQYEWLRADLTSNKTACAAAYWHHPVFSSGDHGNNSLMRAIWRLLDDNGVDVIINAHDHDYERFGLQNADGLADPARGVRQFVVGTGGKSLRAFKSIQPNSEVRDASTYGVFKLTVRTAGYDWEFIPVAGGSFRDSGTGTCN